METEIAKVRAAMQTLQGATGIAGSALTQSMQAGEARVQGLERELRGLNGQLTLTDRVANAMGGTLGQIFWRQPAGQWRHHAGGQGGCFGQ